MHINGMNNNQLNMQKRVNAFGHPMKQQGVNPLDPMSVFNQKREMKKQLMGFGSQQNNKPVNNVIDSSMSYLDSLREARNNNKTAALEKKKLKYSYKAISSKIINCKKSYNAKEVISQAKREVARLKKLRSKGEYDQEELEAAIAHAQSMERIAKKKARHLEEEEMAKAAGGMCMDVIEDESSDKEEQIEDIEFELEAELQDESQEEISEEEMELAEAEMLDEMSELSEEMTDELSELMEDMGLDELFDDMGISGERDIDPADLKMMIIKHRTREMKDIAKADGEYLKVIFEKLERERAGLGEGVKMDAGGMNMSGAVVNIVTPSIEVSTANIPVAEAPVASVDVSV